MKIDPGIRKTLQVISDASVKQANEPNGNYRYIRRLLRVFTKHLNEQEQIYVLSLILEHVHYRNVLTDPDHMLMINNIRIRTHLFIAFLAGLLLVWAAVLFDTNASLNELVDMFSSLLKILQI